MTDIGLTDKQIDEIKSVYYNSRTGLSIKRTYDNLKSKYSRKDVENVVKLQNTAQINQTVDENELRAKYKKVVSQPGSYQADLFFPNQGETVKRFNSGFAIILTIISLATRKLYTYPMKKRDARSVAIEFDKFFKDQKDDVAHEFDIPTVISTDNGAEFANKQVKTALLEHNCELYLIDKKHTNSQQTSVIERANQTLKNALENYLDANETNRWLDALNDITFNYNNSVHSYLKQKPIDVEFDDVMENVIKEKGFNTAQHEKYDLKIGERVRLIKRKKALEKGRTLVIVPKIYRIVKIEGNKYYLQDEKKDKPKTKPVYNYMLRKVDEVQYNKVVEENNKRRDELKIAKRDKKIEKQMKKEDIA
jgi:hypothetical protein